MLFKRTLDHQPFQKFQGIFVFFFQHSSSLPQSQYHFADCVLSSTFDVISWGRVKSPVSTAVKMPVFLIGLQIL